MPTSCSQVARPCARGLAGVHFVGTVHDEYQGENSTKTLVFVEDLWIFYYLPFSWSRSTRLATRVKGLTCVQVFCVETLQNEVDFPCHFLREQIFEVPTSKDGTLLRTDVEVFLYR